VSLSNPTGEKANDAFGTAVAMDSTETFLFVTSLGMGSSGPWIFVFQNRGKQWQHVDSLRASGFGADNNALFAQRLLATQTGELFVVGPGDTQTVWPQMIRVLKNNNGPWVQEWANRWITIARDMNGIAFNKTADFGVVSSLQKEKYGSEVHLFDIERDNKDGKWVTHDNSGYYRLNQDLYATDIAMTENGGYVVVNAPNTAVGGKTNAGEIVVFRRLADNTLGDPQFLAFPTDKLFSWDNTYFGKSVAITQAEEGEIRIFVGVPGVGLQLDPPEDRNGYGAVCVYSMQVDARV